MDKGERTLKLKMLWLYGLRNIRDWHTDVWSKDWGQRMCCNGYMCGCQGTDYAAWWEYLWDSRHG